MMASKDERYDPDIDDYSSSDDEKMTAQNSCSGRELNNACHKLSSPAHLASLESVFVFNNTRNVNERSGGPLSDNPQDNSEPENICLNCEKLTSVWHEGSRFTCHIRYANNQKELDNHNQLCTKCATIKTECRKCPYHLNAFYHESVDENIVPHIVRRFEE